MSQLGGDMVAEFHASRGEGGPVTVRQAVPNRVVAVIPQDIGNDAQQWAWATRISRVLCYQAAGQRRSMRAAFRSFVAGMAVGVAITLGAAAGADKLCHTQCVELGNPTVIPNG